MQHSKLLQLLRSFKESEIKAFGKFLASPYFNSSDKLLRLFLLLKPQYPNFASNKLNKEYVYRRLHGKRKYNDQTMRELTSDLLKLAREFTAHEELRCTPHEMSNARYYWLNKRSALELAKIEIEQSEKLLHSSPPDSSAYYYYRWIIDYNIFLNKTMQVRDAEHKLLKGFKLTAHLDSLDRYYLINFFETYVYLLSFSKIYNYPIDRLLVKPVDTLAAKYINRGDIHMDIYYNMFKLLTTDDEKYYFELKGKFFANDKSMWLALKRETAIILENYCTAKNREGDMRFSSEILQIYRYEIEQDLILHNGVMPYLFYQNVVRTGVDTDDLVWLESFIETHKKDLAEEFREEVYCYARAYLLFAKKKFKESLRMALSANTSDFWNRIEIKNLIARAQYELGMFDQLVQVLDSYKYYLRDEKIPATRKKLYENYRNTMNELLQLAEGYSKDGHSKFLHRLDTEKVLPSKKWFREKVEELAGSKGRNRK